jgi:hypothetical protein
MSVEIYERATGRYQRGRISKQLPGRFVEVTFDVGDVEQVDLERRKWRRSADLVPAEPSRQPPAKAALPEWNGRICETPGPAISNFPQSQVVNAKHPKVASTQANETSSSKGKAGPRGLKALEQVAQPAVTLPVASHSERLADPVAALFNEHAARVAKLVGLKEEAIAKEQFMEVKSPKWVCSHPCGSFVGRLATGMLV